MGIDETVHTKSQSLTSSAINATVHCLTGCAIVEILGMVSEDTR